MHETAVIRIEGATGAAHRARRGNASGATQALAPHRPQTPDPPRSTLLPRSRRVVPPQFGCRVPRPASDASLRTAISHQGLRIRQRREPSPPSRSPAMPIRLTNFSPRVRRSRRADCDRRSQRMRGGQILGRARLHAHRGVGPRLLRRSRLRRAERVRGDGVSLSEASYPSSASEPAPPRWQR